MVLLTHESAHITFLPGNLDGYAALLSTVHVALRAEEK